MFFGSNAYCMFRFIKLAQKWPELMQHWESVDSKLPKWRSEREKGKFAVQIKWTAAVVLLCSLGMAYQVRMKSTDDLNFEEMI